MKTKRTTSQIAAIIEWLSQGESLTAATAWHMFGCARLAARIRNIKDIGYAIVTESININGYRYAKYSLAQ